MVSHMEQLIRTFERIKERDPIAAVKNIHTVAQARILTVAGILDGSFQPDAIGDRLDTRPNDRPIPHQEKWNLRMGDSVEIKFDLPDFKYFQDRTVGWKNHYAQVISEVGFITNICNEYDCHIQVYFPSCFTYIEAYAGVLKKATPPPATTASTFCKGDLVAIQPQQVEVLRLLQRGYSDLPTAVIGKIGEVIGFSPSGIHVTFSRTISHIVNPAVLVPARGKLTNFYLKERNGVHPGDKVKVISNLKNVIAGLDKIDEWENDMSSIAGEEVTVLLVKPRNILRVCRRDGRSYDMPQDLISDEHHDEDEMKGIKEDDVPFELNARVKLRHIDKVTKKLKDKGIPLTILEYLNISAAVTSYSRKLEPGIKYNSTHSIMVSSALLERASEKEERVSAEIRRKSECLAAGDEVCLDVGPPNYVREVLDRCGMDGKVIKLMTSRFIHQGYLDSTHAVIKSSEGMLYQIGCEYLTVPEKFKLPSRQAQMLRPDLVGIIINSLQASLDNIHGDVRVELEKEITSYEITAGAPATLRVTFRSSIASPKLLLDALKKIVKWSLEDLCEGQVIIEKIPGWDQSLKLTVELECAPLRGVSGATQSSLRSEDVPSATSSEKQTPLRLLRSSASDRDGLPKKSAKPIPMFGSLSGKPSEKPDNTGGNTRETMEDSLNLETQPMPDNKAEPPPTAEHPQDGEERESVFEVIFEGRHLLIPYRYPTQHDDAGHRPERAPQPPTGDQQQDII